MILGRRDMRSLPSDYVLGSLCLEAVTHSVIGASAFQLWSKGNDKTGQVFSGEHASATSNVNCVNVNPLLGPLSGISRSPEASGGPVFVAPEPQRRLFV